MASAVVFQDSTYDAYAPARCSPWREASQTPSRGAHLIPATILNAGALFYPWEREPCLGWVQHPRPMEGGLFWWRNPRWEAADFSAWCASSPRGSAAPVR
jgi:hypothetical protein